MYFDNRRAFRNCHCTALSDSNVLLEPSSALPTL